MKKITTILVIVVTFIISLTGCSEAWSRNVKSMKSNWDGGLERTVTVYDYNGHPIKTYEGKFDVSESENEVYFDMDGKRVIIHGGIVINEER